MGNRSYPFATLLNRLGQFSRNVIVEHLRELGIEITKEGGSTERNRLIPEFLDLWAEEIAPRFYPASVLSIQRQVEVLGHLLVFIDLYRRDKASILKQLEAEWQGLSHTEKDEALSRAAWCSINSTNTEKGYRLQCGFLNTALRRFLWPSSGLGEAILC